MATETVQQHSPLEMIKRAEARTDALGTIVFRFLKALASLKLTVVLLGMAIFIVFAGTLAQAEMGLWQAVDTYFRSLICWIDLQIFFPASFFPGQPDIPDWMGFWFPGGWLIGGLMAVNLLAAHGLRFKVQASDSRLAVGLGVILLGMLTTGLVIASGYNPDGFQKSIWDDWGVLWNVMRVGLGAGFLAALYGFVRLWRSDKAEWWLTLVCGVGLAALGGLSVYTILGGQQAQLSDSSMRILWQLIKAAFAALVLLAGCILVFRKRAGIVLLHAGIGLMMLGEIVAGTEVVETVMTLREGETVNYVRHRRELELAVVDRSDPDTDRHVVVPGAILQENEGEDEPIRHGDLPFYVRVIDFMKNSELMRVAPREKNPADSGAGRARLAREVAPISGTDTSERTDATSAYVQFLEKETGEPIGTYLVSFYLNPQPVQVGEKTWHVQLRPKRIYKPYAITLDDVSAKNYIGTTTPKDFRSKVRVVDESRNVDHKATIWMNNPLRFAGETFYQSGYAGPPEVPFEQTTLSVVENPSWMIPYVGCMIVAAGMLMHFVVVLVRFLNRRARSHAVETAESAGEGTEADAAESPQVAMARRFSKSKRAAVGKVQKPAAVAPADAKRLDAGSDRARWLVPLLVAAVFAAFVGRLARPPAPKENQLNLYAFGKQPVTAGGRVKPFNTLALAALRKISKKQTFVPHDAEAESKMFGLYEKRPAEPAVRWLLDVISHSEEADEHQVFRITNLELLDALNLPLRKGLRYSLQEIEAEKDEETGQTELQRQVELARQTFEEQGEDGLTPFQQKVLELNTKVRDYNNLREAHRLPPADAETAYQRVRHLRRVGGIVAARDQFAGIPFAIPVESEAMPWEPLMVAATRNWVQQLAEERGSSSVAELAEQLVTEARQDGSIDQEVEQRLLDVEIVGMFQQALMHEQNLSAEEAARRAMAHLDNISEEMRARLEPLARARITEERKAQFEPLVAQSIQRNLQSAIHNILGEERLGDPPNAVAARLAAVLTAYREGDVPAFNREVKEYDEALGSVAASEFNDGKVRFEAYFNHFAPTFWSIWLYLGAFVLAALGWLGWERGWGRASFWLIVLTLGLHTFALVSRILISGRPPVTNLYSSAVFIAWGSVLLCLVIELIYRNGIAMVVSAVSGCLGLMLAYFVFGREGDTFTVMQAVLDTQFWLATHVVCITLGYTTTYVAGFLGLTYVVRGVLTPSLTPKLGREVSRMIYGTLCFAIFFSFVGTVLGGLWADDSWGRFWGWDPKENGALIIVLWNALVLHARWDGLVKERGLAVLAAVGNLVVTWSWFGTNMLGIGLHAYGGQEGQMLVFKAVMGAYLGLTLLGCLPKNLWFSFHRRRQTAAS